LMPNGIRSRKLMRETLLDWINESRACVLPVIENIEPERDCPVEKALELVTRTKGQQKQDFILYHRRSSSISLPNIVRKQGTWTTTFLPSGMDSGKPGVYGMTEFNRVEIIKNLKTTLAIDESESEELLKFVIEIATETSEIGGGRSIWERVKDSDSGRVWGFLHRDTSLREAWLSLSNLRVPTASGKWLRAREVCDPLSLEGIVNINKDNWPWPILDRNRVQKICSQIDLDFSGSDFATLMGIPQGPPFNYNEESNQYEIQDWETITSGNERYSRVTSAIVQGWNDTYRPLFFSSENEHEFSYSRIKDSLIYHCWLYPSGLEQLDVNLSIPSHLDKKSISPSSVWLQKKGQGFQKVSTLPHIIVERGINPPPWIYNLGIRQVEDTENSITRIVSAIKSLSDAPLLLSQSGRDTEELYTRLIRTLGENRIDLSDDLDIPLLIREYTESGGRGRLKWSEDRDSVWYDSGDYTQALRAFPDYNLWVVRRTSAKLGEKIGVKTFLPKIYPDLKDEEPEENLSGQVKNLIRQILPDVLSTIELMGIMEINIGQLMERWTTLDFAHKVDVWEKVIFEGREGTIGKDERNNSIQYSESNRSKIIFDGSDIKLILLETSEHLADILFKNRNLIPVFNNVIQSIPFHQEGQDALLRYRKKIGITQEEIDEWDHRINRFTLTEEEEDLWVSTISDSLKEFGGLKKPIESVFLSVLPDIWVAESLVNNETEFDVQQSINRALHSLDNKIGAIIPNVNFHDFHEGRLKQFSLINRSEILADYLYSIEEKDWTEVKLESKKQLLSNLCSREESALLKKISCDYKKIIYDRLEIQMNSEDKHSSKWKHAILFAKGLLSVSKLPKLEESMDETDLDIDFSPWNEQLKSPQGRTPASEEDYIENQRRKAERGIKAEEAILVKVVNNMRDWLASDSERMWKTVRASLHIYFPNLVAEIDSLIHETQIKLLKSETNNISSILNEFLHIAERWGDAGFDIIVLEKPNCAFVEVKRIGKLENCVFYISENERTQALRSRDHKLWRLWLVDNEGGCHDITNRFMEKIKQNERQITELRKAGIRPNEYTLTMSSKH